MKNNNMILTILFLSYFSLNLFSQDSTSIQKLIKLEKDLQIQIVLLNDSLAIIQNKIEQIEKDEYLQQLETNTRVSLNIVCPSYGNLRKEANDISEIVKILTKGDTIVLVDYTDGYWLANKENQLGYINEVSIETTWQVEKFKEKLMQSNNEINQIENVEYLKQFESPAVVSIQAVCQINGKIRKGSDLFSDVLTTIKKGETINLSDYERGYWLVHKGTFDGYLNEIYVETTKQVERFKEELIRCKKSNRPKSDIDLNALNSIKTGAETKSKNNSNFYNSSNSSYSKSKSYNNKSKRSSVQCSGRTKKGRSCRNKTTSISGRCHLH